MLKHSRHNSQDSRYSSARHGFEAGDQMPSSTHAHGEAPLRTRGKGFAHAIENVTRTNSFALVVFIILVVGLVGVGIHAALFPKEAGDKAGNSSTYNWDYLKKDNGRFYYSIEGKAESRTGVDVSEHQGYINWDAVAKDGISFAFVRVGNRGLTTGKLSQATTEEEAREEADFVIERLKGRNITYPVAYDHERLADTPGRADDLSPEQMTKNAAAFCARIQEAGYTPMIYGSMKDLLRYNLPDLAHYNIWLAQYNVNAPTLNQYFSIWQYSNTGSVSGIDGNVDMNIQFLAER